MVRLKDICDKYFLENGYWYYEENRDENMTLYETEKFRELMDTVFRIYGNRTLITPEMLVKTMNGKTRRDNYKESNRYVCKISR